MAVVEGTGDHCCEYMTGGVAVVIGATGRNFAAGMSGGAAFVLDEAGDFPRRCNLEMVDLEPLREPEDIELVRDLLIQHAGYTGSTVAARLLSDWDGAVEQVRQGHAARLPPRPRGAEESRGRGPRSDGADGGDPWVSRPDSWNIPREMPTRRPIAERVHDYLEVYNPFPDEKLQAQGARCMDCGIPFCHQGCPLGNLIPDWNDLVYRDQWRAAIDRLHATNNFPEFTGKLCPAPCEASCVLGINNDPVTIKQIEASIIDRAWDEGWVVPQPPQVQTGKTVAVVGSGPAGLACAQQLARAGTRSPSSSGPTGSAACSATASPTSRWRSGTSTAGSGRWRPRGSSSGRASTSASMSPPSELLAEFDAVCLCGGATQPRDLPIEGRELEGIHFAMDFLTAPEPAGGRRHEPWRVHLAPRAST